MKQSQKIFKEVEPDEGKSLITPLAGIFREEADKALKRVKERKLFEKRRREADTYRKKENPNDKP